MGFGAVLFAAMDALSDADKTNREAAIVKLGDTIELEISPAGTIIAFGGTSAPTGYLVCDGAVVSRTGEPVLFAAIGTTWGVGDGLTTFNKPDLRGAGVRGAGSHGSETMADGNPYAGPAVGAFEDDQMQQITGSTTGESDTSILHENPTQSGAFGKAEDNKTYRFQAQVSALGNALTFDSANSTAQGGARTGDETRPFAAGVLWCIKT